VLIGFVQNVLRVVRWRRWAGSKLPLLLAAFTFSVLISDTALDEALLGAGQLLLHVMGYASFGYLANSWADVREDENSGKGSVFSGWSSRRAVATVVGAALVAVLPLLLTANERGAALLFGVTSVAVAAAYSLRPIRLKERGLLGVVSSALAQRTLPTLTILSYFGSVTPPLALFTVLTFVIGVRFILVHQADDFTADQITGTRTFATRVGIHQVEDLIVWLVLPLELIGAGAWLLAARTSLGIIAALLLLYLIVHVLLLVLLARSTRFPLAGYAPLSEFYSAYVPAGLSLAGLMTGDSSLLPVFFSALLLALVMLPGSLLEEFHRMRRLLRRDRRNGETVAADRLEAAARSGIEALEKMQRSDGSFELVKWVRGGRPTEAHHLFASAWVLIVLGKMLPREFSHRAATAISAARDPRGTWNFDPALQIPNDVDSTACAIMALDEAGVAAGERESALLRSQWRPERGRFATWFSDEPAWRSPDRDDPVVNLNVITALQRVGQTLSNEEREGVMRYLASVPPTSRYYCDPMAIPYAAAKANIPIDRARHRSWGRPASRSTTISIAQWITINEETDGSLVAMLMSRQRSDGSWPAEPWFTGVSVPFWGSQAVTTAFCVEALHHVLSRLKGSR
jgi:4-hydroxybenzoate polyprenyltransferase